MENQNEEHIQGKVLTGLSGGFFFFPPLLLLFYGEQNKK